MSLDKHQVAKIARLARIRLTGDEQEHYAGELSGILGWIEQLSEVNTDGVPQMTSVASMKLPMRDDVVTDGHQAEAILANAPVSDYGCFAVPKVIE
ncbi:MAG: Asp-tRNA(Asn)/Glu-tRNA(Gln) amidotransferase subunit GatC [Alphaproteobacteria bacterium]